VQLQLRLVDYYNYAATIILQLLQLQLKKNMGGTLLAYATVTLFRKSWNCRL